MLNKLFVFYEYPVGVRYALGLLLGGWISVYAFMYHINTFFPDRFPNPLILKNLVVGIGICYCVFRIKPWARKLCIFLIWGLSASTYCFSPYVLHQSEWNLLV